MLLEEKADIYAAGHAGMDTMFNIDGNSRKLINPGPKKDKKGGGGHALFCAYYNTPNSHYTNHCPQKAADTRNEKEKCVANHQAHGTS
eukprot:4816223-Karenia_brevis.AAC.1